jgi:quercetin dioxygenase-like cupin family protein
MKFPATFLVAFAAVLSLVACGKGAQDQNLDMVKVCAPPKCTVLIDKPHVRVSRVVLKPGESTGMHSHEDDDIWMPKVEAKVKTTDENGRTQENTADPKQVYWNAPVTHNVENTGTTDYESIVIEIKR